MKQRRRRRTENRKAATERWQVVCDHDRAYAYISAAYDFDRSEGFKGICQLKAGEVVGAVGYDTYNGQNIFMHVASDLSRKWATRHFIHEVFKYPFVTLGVQRVTCWIEEDNRLSVALVRALGFSPEAVLHKAGRDGQDVLIYRMFRQECRYA